MFYKVILLLLPGLTLIALNSVNFLGCSSDPVSPIETVKFSRDILPIFAQNCNFPGCHNSFDKSDGIDLTSWNSLMFQGSNIGPLVIPYNAWWSNLVQHINRDTNIAPVVTPYMPKAQLPYTNGSPLPQNIVMLIMRWINEGAKNDNGEVAFSNITRKAFISNQASDYIAVVNLDNNFLVRLVDVGGRNNQTQPLDVPHHVTVDNQGRYFYPALIAEGYLEKLDAVTYEKVGRLFLGSAPAEIFLLSNGTKGYVTNWDASGLERNVKFIDTQNMTVLDTISDIRMKATHGARITHDDNYLIVISQLSEYILVIRTSDNQIEDAV
ncbi:MAG: YncE family protein, partial [Ignavibacteria bacterium]